MNHTSVMTQLLGAFRRERNGLVADTMHYEGARYGLNYGVSLPTVRQIVRGMERDHDFARFLYGQDVRCLKLAAIHLADAEQLADPTEVEFWLAGIRNSELAEEAAFALVSRYTGFATLYEERVSTAEPMHLYLLLMAAARHAAPAVEWLESSYAAVVRYAEHPLHRLLTAALITLWAAIGVSSDEARNQTAELLARLESSVWNDHLREEIAWRIA